MSDAPPAAPVVTEPVKPAEALPMTLVVVSGISGGLFVLLPILVRKGPNRGITRCCIMLTVFSMWIFWATVYISQMRPLMGPRMHNTSLAWMRYAWMGLGLNESDGNATDSNVTETEAFELYLD
ncbi:V-type proton ATPase subunit e 1-like isoform X1 [Choristoneura fumiferana]|uniref:V-type proton ATPase subunit e 1-like isoform X1 n=1 Tax=Choristoneura fumiferana TaxID=7141 RepID=UPI003D153E65